MMDADFMAREDENGCDLRLRNFIANTVCLMVNVSWKWVVLEAVLSGCRRGGGRRLGGLGFPAA